MVYNSRGSRACSVQQSCRSTLGNSVECEMCCGWGGGGWWLHILRSPRSYPTILSVDGVAKHSQHWGETRELGAFVKNVKLTTSMEEEEPHRGRNFGALARLMS